MRPLIIRHWLVWALAIALFPQATRAVTGSDVQDRMQQDVLAGRPLVAHVVVALADNDNQGIVPVPKALGNGQDPRNNLYWGALYGVRSFLIRHAGWKVVPQTGEMPEGVLRRVVLTTEVERREAGRVRVFVVADAWNGYAFRESIEYLLEMARGGHREALDVDVGDATFHLSAGGGAHMIAYAGHNGLMEHNVAGLSSPIGPPLARSVMVLACQSRTFFKDLLAKAGVHQLLLTTTNMAPEAYTLDAVLKKWLAGHSSLETHEAAAQAYCKYQDCRVSWGRRLFSYEP